MFLSNEVAFDEFLNLNFDCLHNIRLEASLLLFDRLSIRFDAETIYGYLRVKTRHVFIASSKDVNILQYEGYKALFLY